MRKLIIICLIIVIGLNAWDIWKLQQKVAHLEHKVETQDKIIEGVMYALVDMKVAEEKYKEVHHCTGITKEQIK